MRRKILLIDDEPINYDYMSAAIQEYARAYDLVCAPNGFFGVEVYKSDRPELVFLDNMMPGKSGVEVFHELQDINPEVKVVGYTAVDCPRFKQLLNEGMLELVKKPMELQTLLEILAKHT